MIKREVNRRDDSEKCTVVCDTCGRSTPKVDHPTAGDAADHARLAGFVTRGEGIVTPLTWHCGPCQAKTKTK